MMPPLGICTSEATANAEAPPPAGSTATHTCRVFSARLSS